MPTYKYEFIINNKVDYTCYSMKEVIFYEKNFDEQGVSYKLVTTALK